MKQGRKDRKRGKMRKEIRKKARRLGKSSMELPPQPVHLADRQQMLQSIQLSIPVCEKSSTHTKMPKRS